MTKDQLEEYFDRLFPIARSITGEGYRKSLKILKEVIPFEYIDIESGKNVFDWTVPEEWKVTEAYIIDPEGYKILDYKDHNLHVLNYSDPVDASIELQELRDHIFTIPELPSAIPYVTSYYKNNWGFCMRHDHYENLKDGRYKVLINSTVKEGFVRIGECLLPGESKKEILISSYLCHPSMANNELSGPLTMLYLYQYLKQIKNRRFSYRFVINPETIGSISYLNFNLEILKDNLLGGIVLNCLGGPNSQLSYKTSKYSNSVIDKFFLRKEREDKIKIRPFTPMGGSDERQYNSPKINLPVGQLGRTIYEEHPEYHNSLDNKEFMDISQVELSCEEILGYLLEIENLNIYKVTNGYGEPFLSKHNLYPSINSNTTRKEDSGDRLKDGKRQQRAVMFLLSYSDGLNSTTDIANLINENTDYVDAVAQSLEEKKLIEKI